MDFTLIRRAGLSQGEFGKLVGVSRVTVNYWCRDQNPKTPNKFVAPKVTRLLGALEAAVGAGALPLPDDLDRTERLRGVLKQFLTQ